MCNTKLPWTAWAELSRCDELLNWTTLCLWLYLLFFYCCVYCVSEHHRRAHVRVHCTCIHHTGTETHFGCQVLESLSIDGWRILYSIACKADRFPMHCDLAWLLYLLWFERHIQRSLRECFFVVVVAVSRFFSLYFSISHWLIVWQACVKNVAVRAARPYIQ